MSIKEMLMTEHRPFHTLLQKQTKTHCPTIYGLSQLVPKP
ncbi:hypothetical protein Ah1_00266 [Aeromonas phage Ah1]|uniref:Uncharacterized protein n=1 Tax=Aeromonas phage Ah1 TaxID=2053701 RepID=A0A2H4YFM4_9CAUD|nr:hypothetical protein KNT77_gp252 [Aeromonas phage Ah1]AUE22784.1 hypothetical protein Ah1_00266 [Aeromonas phage Ah1]